MLVWERPRSQTCLVGYRLQRFRFYTEQRHVNPIVQFSFAWQDAVMKQTFWYEDFSMGIYRKELHFYNSNCYNKSCGIPYYGAFLEQWVKNV